MRYKSLRAAPAHVHSAHAAFCCWRTACSPTQPVLRTDLMAPAWRLTHVSRGVILDLRSQSGEIWGGVIVGVFRPCQFLVSRGPLEGKYPHLALNLYRIHIGNRDISASPRPTPMPWAGLPNLVLNFIQLRRPSAYSPIS